MRALLHQARNQGLKFSAHQVFEIVQHQQQTLSRQCSQDGVKDGPLWLPLYLERIGNSVPDLACLAQAGEGNEGNPVRKRIGNGRRNLRIRFVLKRISPRNCY